MTPTQSPSPGSELVSCSIAHYLWLFIEAHQLSLCTWQCCSGDRIEQMSCADQIYFKDIQPQREGQELSSLPVPDQPNTKYSSSKSRRIFKMVAVGELWCEVVMLASWDGVAKRKESKSEHFLLCYWRDLHHLSNTDKPFSQTPKGISENWGSNTAPNKCRECQPPPREEELTIRSLDMNGLNRTKQTWQINTKL